MIDAQPADRIACYVVTDIETDGPDPGACVRTAYPPSWFGGHEHTHKAIDDALGYASVLRHVLSLP